MPSQGPQNTFQIEPNLAWNKGRHVMRFGGQFTYTQLNITYSPYAQAEEQLGWALQDSLNDLVNAAGTSGGPAPELGQRFALRRFRPPAGSAGP